MAVGVRRRPELDEHLAVRVEELSKVYFPEARRMHEAPVSIVDRMLGRRTADIGSIDDESGMDVDDDAATDEEEEAVADGAAWGLRSATFDIPRGSAVAVVGPPGSGKTTLLMLLAGLVPPTGGRALVRGVIWPPLGFLVNFLGPGVTVRQNLRLIARVADVPLEQLSAHIDEITELLELPAAKVQVMQKRDLRPLALLAGLMVEPDVMLIDSPSLFGPPPLRAAVLPLLEGLRDRGTTILMEEPPHELADVLCDTALWLNGGSLLDLGAKDDVLPRYVAAALEKSTFPQIAWTDAGTELRSFSAALALLTASTEDANGEPRATFAGDEPLVVKIGVEVAQPPVGIRIGLSLIEHGGGRVWVEQPRPHTLEAAGVHEIIARLAPDALPPGRYTGHVEVIVTASGSESTIGRSNVFAVEARGDGAALAPAEDWLRRDADWDVTRPLTPEL